MATYTDQQYINAIKQVYGNNIDPGLLQTYLNSAKTGYGAIWNNINSKLSAPPTQTPPPTYNPAPPASSGSGSYGT